MPARAEQAGTSSRRLGLADAARLGPPVPLKPAFLSAVDEPWLRRLLDERLHFVGKPVRAFEGHVADGFSPAPPPKLRAALRALARCELRPPANQHGPDLRSVLFAAACGRLDRARVIAEVAHARGLSVPDVEAQLFADLHSERALGPLTLALSPTELAARANVELLTQILARALVVRIEAYGEVRAVVRHAKLLGLLCELVPSGKGPLAVLEISGPFALFQHSRLYARALASLVPRLAHCRTYRLEADCALAGGARLARVSVCAGDPVLPARELPRFDSKLEERFARDFGRLAPDWELVREPTPLRAGRQLIFPDFGLRHRATGELFLLEIVGYWTPSYLERKLTTLREAQCQHLVLCVDADKACESHVLPPGAAVIPFRRHIDARAVLARIDPLAAQRLATEGPRGARKVRGAQGRAVAGAQPARREPHGRGERAQPSAPRAR